MSAAELRVGVWKLDSGKGDLVIAEVKPSGEVVGQIDRRPFKGTWDGKKLSFATNEGLDFSSFQGWLVREAKGGESQFTLTGVCVTHTHAAFLPAEVRDIFPVTTGWYARLDQTPKK